MSPLDARRSPLIVLPLPRLDAMTAPSCGLVHPNAGAFSMADAPLLPCHLDLGHEGRHCFDSDDSDAAEDPGTLRWLIGSAAVEYAEHLQICDACGAMDGPHCAVGEIKLNTVGDLLDRIRGRLDRGR